MTGTPTTKPKGNTARMARSEETALANGSLAKVGEARGEQKTRMCHTVLLWFESANVENVTASRERKVVQR